MDISETDKVHTKRKRIKPYWILVIVLIIFIWIIISRFTELHEIADTISQGKWQWVFVALLMQLIYYFFFTKLYDLCFEIVGVQSTTKELLPVMFASVFANLAPTGGASGAALFVHDAVKRKQSGAKAAIGSLLVQIIDFGMFIFILIQGLAYLLIQQSLKKYQLIASAVLFLFVGVMITILMLAFWQPILTQKLLQLFQRLVNKLARIIIHRNVFDDQWSERNAIELKDAAYAITKHPKLVLKACLMVLLADLSNIATIFFLYLAFNQHLALGVLITGYSMTHLFSTIAITPQGIGVVEGVMTVMYSSLGITPERAAVVAIAFRGLNLWLPLIIGFIVLRRLRMFKDEKEVHPLQNVPL
jgi:uncharacterized protein (TIRG00374 family)